jgi:hypothetical protein
MSRPARRLVVLNLAPQPGETEGFSPHAHLEVLADHAPALTVDVVLADAKPRRERWPSWRRRRPARRQAGDWRPGRGGRVPPRHDPRRLAGAFAQIFEGEGRLGGSDAMAMTGLVKDELSRVRC